MKNILNKLLLATAICALPFTQALASSHREAPLIAADPQADNTDVYAFRSPCDSSKVVIIANYIPFQLPQGGPNYYSFGQNIRYEIHIKNKATIGPGNGDDITYRFTFNVTNEDTTTFFNIRLGKQNQKVTYTCEKSTDGGINFTTIKSAGVVPPNNIGPRSIEGAAGLAATGYGQVMNNAITTASTGEQLFAGPADDPFFVDLGGAFDVGNFRKQAAGGRDGLAKYNVSSIVLEIPITMLQKTGLSTSQATSILDPNFVIGVWASASRQQITTLNTNGSPTTPTGPFIQISRLGMPLVNEVINPIGQKDQWNSTNPYTGDGTYAPNFKNPELALYMDNSQYGGAVPGLADLRVQSASPTAFGPSVDFRNGKPGLYIFKGNSALIGTALAPGPSGGGAGFGDILLPDNASPRAVDILPIFYTGVPNLSPYQLNTGKIPGNPLSAGKPFINNFLPTLSDMLRLNMAVPVTSRSSADFSSLGILKAAVLGLTDTRFNANTTIQNIPNMDGFPNGRRLEDDVTTIELQAVGGVALAAIGLFYDDYVIASGNPLTPRLLTTIGFDAGVTHNDTTFQACMPYVQQPWRGFAGASYSAPPPYVQNVGISGLGLSAPDAVMVAYPNPFRNQVSFKYKIAASGNVSIDVVDLNGRLVQRINQGSQPAGEHIAQWSNGNVAAGTYFGRLSINGSEVQAVKLTKTN